MPISKEALDKAVNRHVLLKGSNTILDALAELDHQNGGEWWHIVVDTGNESFAAAQFSSLREGVENEGRTYLDKKLSQAGLTRVNSIDRDSIDSEEVESKARSSPGNLLVVTAEGKVQGIIYAGTTRGSMEAFASASLLELAGNLVDLKKHRSALLDDL